MYIAEYANKLNIHMYVQLYVRIYTIKCEAFLTLELCGICISKLYAVIDAQPPLSILRSPI